MNELHLDPQFTPEKLVSSKKLVELVSCDKSGSIAYSIKQFNIEQQKAVSNLYMHNAESMSGCQLTRCPIGKQCSSPQFITSFGAGAVDSMCFMRDGQVWMMPMSRGEAVQITNFPLDVECYRVFINKYEQIFMLVVMDVYADKTPAETRDLDAKPSATSAMEFDSLMVRHWDRWGPYKKRQHIFLCAMEVTSDGLLAPMQRQSEGRASEDALLDLMPGWESDCPGKAPGQGEADFAVSQDGMQLAFSCRVVNPEQEQGDGATSAQRRQFKKPVDMAWSTDTNVYLLNLPKHYSEMKPATFTPVMNCACAGGCCGGAAGAVVKATTAVASAATTSEGDYGSPVERKISCCSASGDSKFSYTVIAARNHKCACGCTCTSQASACSNGSVNNTPVFSPNGAHLVYTSLQRAQFESDRAELKFYHIATGVTTAITSGVDLSFDGSVEWCSSGANALEFYSFGQFHASMRIFKVKTTAVDSDEAPTSPAFIQQIEVLNGDRSCMAPKFLSGKGTTDYLYYIESSALSAPELKLVSMKRDKPEADLFSVFATALDGKCTTNSASSAANTYSRGRITEPGVVPLVDNASHRIISVYSCAPEFENGDIAMPSELVKHYFMGSNDELIQAWYMPPVLGAGSSSADAERSLSKAGSVPLAVIIHGGPQGAILNQWHYRWNMAIFAALGYGVVAINFHGSTGFGQAFTDSITKDWGGKPYRDIIAGVQYILGQYSYLNADKVAGLGASYGGYMINWINGHNPDGLFKCLVNHDGVFDNHSMYYTTEELFFSEFEFGLPWENEAEYKKLSPSSYVQNWETPTLVIHGGKDYRVPETEGIATFTALQRRGVPSKFLYFPDENHWVLKPMNSVKWHKTIFEWLKQWVQ